MAAFPRIREDDTMAIEISAVSAGLAAQAASPVASLRSPGVSGESPQGTASPLRTSAKVAQDGTAYGYYAKLEGKHLQAQSIQDGRFSQAGDARKNGQALGDAEDILAQAEKALGGIVKHYPPYLIDSAERIAQLNQIAGLRKQIEALDFPPSTPPETGERIPVFGKLLSVTEEPPAEIPDEALAALLEEVEVARAEVNTLRDEMWSDLFVGDARSDERVAVAQADASRTALAGIELPLSAAPLLLSDMA